MKGVVVLIWLGMAVERTDGGSTVSEPNCPAYGLDLFFLVDESYKIDVESQLAFIKDLMVHYAPSKTRESVTGYGRKLHPLVQLRHHQRGELSATLDNTNTWVGMTDTAATIEYTTMQSIKRRTYYYGATRPQVAIVMTDGGSTNATATAEKAKIARDEGIIMFAILFGERTAESEAEVRAIASDPHSEHAYLGPNENYADLQSFKEKIVAITCPPPECDEGWTEFMGKCYKITWCWYCTPFYTGYLCIGRMAAIPTQAHQDFITNLRKERGKFTIGLKYNSATYQWIWSDGAPLNYTNWWTPGDAVVEDARYCVVMDYKHKKWRRVSCVNTVNNNGYIRERDPQVPRL